MWASDLADQPEMSFLTKPLSSWRYSQISYFCTLCGSSEQSSSQAHKVLNGLGMHRVMVISKPGSALHLTVWNFMDEKRKLITITYHHHLLKSTLRLAVKRKKENFCPSTFFQKVTAATEFAPLQWWCMGWEAPGSISAAQGADTGYGSAKVRYISVMETKPCVWNKMFLLSAGEESGYLWA